MNFWKVNLCNDYLSLKDENLSSMDQEGSDVSGSGNSAAINLSSRPASAPNAAFTPVEKDKSNMDTDSLDDQVALSPLTYIYFKKTGGH